MTVLERWVSGAIYTKGGNPADGSFSWALICYSKKKGAVAHPSSFCRKAVNYLIALSVIVVVNAPSGAFVMIFWSSNALAVRS